MKIEELKVGDRVKYKIDIMPFIGDIIELTSNKFKITVNNGYQEPRWIRREQIISKLDTQYKEIPIEKETTEELIEEIENLLKEKSMSKSFKFDISYVNRVEFNQSPYRPGEFASSFFKIDGCQIKYYPNNPDMIDMNGKTYTIEIKETE